MNLPSRNIQQPFLFWLINEFAGGDQSVEEDVRPISDREFYLWIGILSLALLVYGIVFQVMA